MGQFMQNVFHKPMNLFSHSNHRVHSSLYIEWDCSVAQMVQILPAMQETLVLSLGWKEPLEKRMATHSSILGWRIPWTEEPGGLQSMGSQRIRRDLMTKHCSGGPLALSNASAPLPELFHNRIMVIKAMLCSGRGPLPFA